MLVMLRRDWGGPFRRSLDRNKKNQPIEGGRVLVFQPGEPLEVDKADLPAIADCLGKNLQEVAVDGKGRARQVDRSAPADESPAGQTPAAVDHAPPPRTSEKKNANGNESKPDAAPAAGKKSSKKSSKRPTRRGSKKSTKPRRR